MHAIPEDTLKRARALAKRRYDTLRQDPEYAYAHPSHTARKALESVEEELKLPTHGVEGFTECGGCMYLNTGDSYGCTILFRNGRFLIGAWGDIVERYC